MTGLLLLGHTGLCERCAGALIHACREAAAGGRMEAGRGRSSGHCMLRIMWIGI